MCLYICLHFILNSPFTQFELSEREREKEGWKGGVESFDKDLHKAKSLCWIKKVKQLNCIVIVVYRRKRTIVTA